MGFFQSLKWSDPEYEIFLQHYAYVSICIYLQSHGKEHYFYRFMYNNEVYKLMIFITMYN